MLYPFHGRRLARALVVETIYNAEILDENLDEIFENLSAMKRDYFQKLIREIRKESVREKFLKDLNSWESIISFSKSILNSYKLNREKIEEILRKNVVGEWDYERLFYVEKAILKTAISELLVLDTPYKVVISEALNLADFLVSDEAVKLLNAILDKIAKTLAFKNE